MLDRCLDEAMDVLLGTVDVELLEQKGESALQVGGDRRADVLVQRPEVALERPDRLLPGLVVELLRGVAALPLGGGVLVQPGPYAIAKRGGKLRVIEDDVLEVGGEVDLGSLDAGKVTERVRGKRAGAVLHRPGQVVFLAGRLGQRRERLQIELDVGDRAVGKHDATV